MRLFDEFFSDPLKQAKKEKENQTNASIPRQGIGQKLRTSSYAVTPPTLPSSGHLPLIWSFAVVFVILVALCAGAAAFVVPGDKLIVVAIILYGCALTVTAYDKYCTMLDRWEKPGLYNNGVLFPVFFVTKTALNVGAYFLLYRTGGIFVFAVAIVAQFSFGSVLLQKFFKRRVAIWYPCCLKAVREGQRADEPALSEAEIESQAMEQARNGALRAMRNET